MVSAKDAGNSIITHRWTQMNSTDLKQHWSKRIARLHQTTQLALVGAEGKIQLDQALTSSGRFNPESSAAGLQDLSKNEVQHLMRVPSREVGSTRVSDWFLTQLELHQAFFFLVCIHDCSDSCDACLGLWRRAI